MGEINDKDDSSEETRPMSFDSVLNSTKKMAGITEDNKAFDLDVLLIINSAISVLFQLGVNFTKTSIDSEDTTYNDLVGNASDYTINFLKTYFAYKVKLALDSASMTGAVISVYEKEIKEIEWRLMSSYEDPDSLEPEKKGENQNE